MLGPHVLFFIALAATSTVSAKENQLTGKQILQKMVSAMETSNYEGTVVFLKNDKLEAMKYFHTNVDNKEQERLVSLNSPQREIVRKSNEIKCFYKLTQQVIVDHKPYEHSFIVDVPKNLDESDSSYDFQITGEEDVAMMPSYVVTIQPKDEFRYTRKIWIAKDVYLPLKAVVYAPTGIVLEQVVFTEFATPKSLSNKSPDIRQEPLKTIVAESMAVAEPTSQVAFEVTAIPQGFKQIFFSRKPLRKSEEPVDHLLLSDGFASVSVYLETKKNQTAPDSRIPEGIHSVGAVNSMSQTLADSQLTVLGEVPATTVKFITDGIKLRNPSQ